MDKKNIRLDFKQLLILSSIVLMIVFVSITCIQSYLNTQEYILSKIENVNVNSLAQAAQQLESKLFQIESIVRYLATDKTLAEKIAEYNREESIARKLRIKEDIFALLVRMKQFSEHISSIVVFTSDRSFYSGYGAPFYKTTHHEILNSPLGKRFRKSSQEKVILFEKINTNHSAAQVCPNELKTLIDNYSFGSLIIYDGIEYGSIFAIIDSNLFDTIFLEHNNFIISGSDGRVLWTGNSIRNDELEAIKGQKLSSWQNSIKYGKNNKFTLYQTVLSYNGWKLLYIQRNSEISKKMGTLKTLTLIALIVSISFAIILSQLISKKIAKPVRELTNSVINCDLESREIPVKYNKKNYRISLRESIIYYLVGIIFIPICLYMMVSHIFTQNLVKNYIIHSHFSTFQQTAENIDYYILTKEKIIKSIAYNECIQNLLDEESRSYYFAKKTSMNQVDSAVNDIIRLSQGKDDIFIYNKDKNLVYSNTYHRQQPDIDIAIPEDFVQNNNIFRWLDTQFDPYYRPNLCVTMKINHISNYNTIGYLHCRISENNLENIYKHSASSGNIIYIVDQSNKIISHPDKDKISSLAEVIMPPNTKIHIDKSNNSFYFKLPLSSSPWYLVGQFPLSLFQKDQQTLLFEKFYMLIFIFFTTIFVAHIFSYYLISSINQINRMLKKVGIDNMEIEFPQDSLIHEINELGEAFNDMVARIYSLIDQLILSTKKQHELENKKKEAELAALQTQINPHFLYNTFDSINWLIKSNELTQATLMLNALSELLRYTAKSNEPVVTIREEIDYAKHYALIMQMRFGSELEFLWDIEPSVLDQKIIRLILQPLIENAIYHGIQPKGSAGFIKVSCYQKDNTIILKVSDNGIGISEEALELINRNLQSDSYHECIGLYNVQNRIKLFFGKEYGLTLHSKLGQGTAVKIRIPSTAIY